LGFLRQFHAALQNAAASLPSASRTQFRFIIIADRRKKNALEQTIKMAIAAKQDMSDFIVGLDLAGDESVNRPQDIAKFFLPAFEECLPLTIHAGEGEAAESIWQAAYHLHADRIGHGLSISDHPQLAERFRNRDICLELCPSSNREVVGYYDPEFPDSAGCENYPLQKLWQMGLPLTLCTDNPGISRTSITDEYLAAARMTGGALTCWDALAMIKQGFVHAFLPGKDKEKLIKQADQEIYTQVAGQYETKGAGAASAALALRQTGTQDR
jgi:adenosine deaminase